MPDAKLSGAFDAYSCFLRSLMPTCRTKLVLLTFATMFLASQAVAQAPTGTCLPATDSTSQRMVRYLDTLVTSSDSGQQQLVHILSLSSPTLSDVSPVTNDSICTQAAVALNSIARVKRSSISLYVVKVKNVFAVVDTVARINGGYPLWFFDSNWSYVNLLEWF